MASHDEKKGGPPGEPKPPHVAPPHVIALVGRLSAQPDKRESTLAEIIKHAEDEEGRKDLLAAGIAAPLVAAVQEPTSSINTVAAQAVAEMAKLEDSRLPLGEAGAMEAVATLLQNADGNAALHETTWQCLRALGNLLFDSDENRVRLQLAGIVPLLLKNASLVQDHVLGRTACGVLANFMAGDKDEYALVVMGENGHQVLVKVLGQYVTGAVESDHGALALKAVHTSYCEKTRDVYVAVDLITELHAVLRHARQEGEGFITELLNILRHITSVNETDRGKMVPLLDTLLDIVETATEDDLDEKTVAFEILAAAGENDQCASIMLAKDGMDRFHSQLVRMDATTDKALRKAALNSLGNLANTEITCKMVVDRGYLPTFVAALGSEEVEIAHLGAGVMRNLAIPEDNKHRLVAAGVPAAIAPIVLGPHEPLQFYGASVYRNLIKPAHADLAAIVAAIPELIVRLAELSVPTRNQMVKTECSRVLVNLLHANSDAVVEQIVMAGGAVSYAELAGNSDRRLHAEALGALKTIIGAEGGKHAARVAATEGVHKALLERARSTDDASRAEAKAIAALLVAHNDSYKEVVDAQLPTEHAPEKSS